MSKFGIDVSKHNGNIDWEKVKSQIDFAILRIGWIGNKENHTIDEQFERNYSECKRLGIPIGVYVYNYCKSEETVKSGANWVLNKLQGKSLELPVYIDMEDSSIENLGKDNLTNIVKAFAKIIEKNNFWCGVYANKNWFDNFLNKEEIKELYTTWIAHYRNGTNKYEGEYDVWQNSNKGKISGITGKVDTNFMYRDLIQAIKDTNFTTSKTTDYFDKCDFYHSSLVDALKSIGVDSSYDNREAIANKNGILNYTGTYKQNIKLLNLLKNGKLKK